MSTHSPNSDSSAPPNAAPPESAGAETTADSPKVEQKPGADTASSAGEKREQQPLNETVQPDPAEKPLVDEAVGEAQDSGRNDAPAKAFPLAERIPLQVYTDETLGQKWSHWGPTVTSIFSLVLTYFVWSYGHSLGEQQFKLQQQQVQAQLADMRSKFFADLTSTDENKRTLAEIGLAGYGPNAMPVVHMALCVEQRDIRKSAVNIVYRLFQAEMNPQGRDEILTNLMFTFDSPNKNLRMGVVQILARLEPLLNPTERQRVVTFLEAKVDPQKICSDWQGRDTVLEAASFVGIQKTETAYLLAVAQCPACGSGWLQSMIRLAEITENLEGPQRLDLHKKISKIRGDALAHLRENVSDKDLNLGAGFSLFMDDKQKGLSFKEFKTRVELEFDELIARLGGE